jgi:hypothetical protein
MESKDVILAWFEAVTLALSVFMSENANTSHVRIACNSAECEGVLRHQVLVVGTSQAMLICPTCEQAVKFLRTGVTAIREAGIAAGGDEDES